MYKRIGLFIALGISYCALATGVSQARETLILQDFSFQSAEQARAAWKPMPKGPNVITARRGNLEVLLPCDMKKNPVRVYWDHHRNINLASFSSFEFELGCQHPEAIEKVMIYFKSGAGWYVSSQPLLQVGWNRLAFTRSEFETEGTPGPWSRIERIRVSFTKGASVDTVLTPKRLTALRDKVAIWQSDVSLRTSSAKRVASQTTDRLSGWLKDYYITHSLLTDKTLTTASLEGIKVLILGYNPHPQPEHLRAIRGFVQKGGKLIVCHATSQVIADLMGVRMEPLVNTNTAGRWNAMKFKAGTPFLPNRIYQHVWNLVPIYPKNGAGTTIAHWEDARQKPTNYPAVVRTKNGYWLSQILHGGDRQNKQSLLVKMLGDLDPSNWRLAAASRLDKSARTLGCSGISEISYHLRSLADKAQQPDIILGAIENLKVVDASMRNSFEKERYPEALKYGHQLRYEIDMAYSQAQPPAPKAELRGLWDQNGTGLYAGDWDRTCRRLSSLGFNAIFPNMLWSGKAHYNSKTVPPSKTFERFGDQVQQALAACNKHNIELHVWKVCWKVENSDPVFLAKVKKEGRMQMSRYGHVQNWLCPSQTVNRKHEIDSTVELVAKHPVHGLHLDYLRYPDINSCFCTHCRKGFEHRVGKKVAKWPEEVVAGGRLRSAFESYRAAQITLFTREISKKLHSVRPNIKLSVAVFPSYPDTIPGIGQDYGAWLKEGIVDFLTPMNYTNDPGQFGNWVRTQTNLSGAWKRILPGIGLISNEAELDVGDTIQQMQLARKLGCPGFVFFKLDHAPMEQVFPLLPLSP